MGKAWICQWRGHMIYTDEVKRALESDMSVECDRCGIHQPIEIDEEKHVQMKPTGEPEIWISGADLGHVDDYRE
jgi:hypothetical protein